MSGMVCRTCEADNPVGARFCNTCGSGHLHSPAPSAEGRVIRSPTSSATVRHGAGRPGRPRRAHPAPAAGAGPGTRRAAPRLRPVRRPRRLHDAVGVARRRGRPRAARPLLRDGADDRRPLRRHDREVHRRRGDGGLGRADRARGRRRARRARRRSSSSTRSRRFGEDVGAPELRARAGRRHRAGRRRWTSPARAWSSATASTPPRACSRPPSPAAVFVDEVDPPGRPPPAIAYDDAGEHDAQGQGRAAAAVARDARGRRRRGGQRRATASRRRSSAATPSCGCVKELFHATVERGAARLVARLGRGRASASRGCGWEFEKYTRRARRRRALALRPLPVLRRGRRVLGAGRDGPPAARDRRGGRPPDEVARQARDGRWSAGSPTRTSARAIAPRARRAARRRRARASAREELFAGWRLFFERLAEHDAGRPGLRGPAVGRRRACSTSSTTCSTGRPSSRSSCSRSPGPSCSSAAPGWPRRAPRRDRDLPRAARRRRDRRSCSTAWSPDLPATALRRASSTQAEGDPAVRGRDGARAGRPRRAAPRRRRASSAWSATSASSTSRPASARCSRRGSTRSSPRSASSSRRWPCSAAASRGRRVAALAGLARGPARRRARRRSCARRSSAVRADPLSPERGQYAFAQRMLRTVAYEMLRDAGAQAAPPGGRRVPAARRSPTTARRLPRSSPPTTWRPIVPARGRPDAASCAPRPSRRCAAPAQRAGSSGAPEVAERAYRRP